MSAKQTHQLILQICHVDRKFRRARDQIVLLNNQIEALLVRYHRAKGEDCRSVYCAVRMHIATIEGVRNMYFEYARQQCEFIDVLQTTLKDLTGTEYNDFPDY